MSSAKVQNQAREIRSIANKITGVYKPHEYGLVILPLVVIRRFDCILESTKEDVLSKFNTLEANDGFKNQKLERNSKQKFLNTIKFTIKSLVQDTEHINDNFINYLDDKITHEYYKIEKKFEGNIYLENNPDGVSPISGGLVGKEKKKDPLSIIIDNINKKFGTSFTEADKLLQQLQEDMLKSDELIGFGKNNNI